MTIVGVHREQNPVECEPQRYARWMLRGTSDPAARSLSVDDGVGKGAAITAMGFGAELTLLTESMTAGQKVDFLRFNGTGGHVLNIQSIQAVCVAMEEMKKGCKSLSNPSMEPPSPGLYS